MTDTPTSTDRQVNRAEWYATLGRKIAVMSYPENEARVGELCAKAAMTDEETDEFTMILLGPPRPAS